MKIIEWIKDRLPINRKEYLKDLRNIKIVLDAVVQAERQHSQIEMNLAKNVDGLNTAKQQQETQSKTADQNDVAFN